MIHSDVMAQLAEKKAAIAAQKAALEAQAAELDLELNNLNNDVALSQDALVAFEAVLSQTPDTLKPSLFPMLFKALEQESKRLGIQLKTALTTDAIVNAQSNGNGKAKTRKTKDNLTAPEEFQVFSQNKRLGVDGRITDDSVRYSKVYIGVDSLRATPASESAAPLWREWLKFSGISDSIKTGDFFLAATTSGLQGNYVLELSEVMLKDLSKLIDLDFSKAPTSEENESAMNRDYAELKLLEEDTKPAEPEEVEQPEPAEQTEEIMETEPVKVTPTKSLYPIGTKFQLVGVAGYDGHYGEVVGLKIGSSQPYECHIPTAFKDIKPMLRHEQLQVIEALEKDEALANIPFQTLLDFLNFNLKAHYNQWVFY